MKSKLTGQSGFTIIELLTTMTMSAIVILCAGVALVGSERRLTRVYNSAHSEVVSGSYVASRVFEIVVRKASREELQLDDLGNWVEVYYYDSADSTSVDRYALLYVSNGFFNVDYGWLDPRVTSSSQTVCGNVSSCIFRHNGRSVQMILTLDNGSEAITTVTSAARQNP